LKFWKQGVGELIGGDGSSSAGSETLLDPLEKLALDVGLLDRQYRRLMNRQRQTQIVVGGT